MYKNLSIVLAGMAVIFCSARCPAQIINTVAGSGINGFSGDGGAATLAKISTTYGITTDQYGNLYIVDRANERVRKVATDGTITTIAGNGTASLTVINGIPATAASISQPEGVAVDRAGNVYISDAGNNHWCVRKVTTSGIITAFAGNCSNGNSGDGGPATAAELSQPGHLAIDDTGNIYICDMNMQRIRKVDTFGIISGFAGVGIMGFYGDGGPATNSEFQHLFDVRVGPGGNVFVCDYNRVRKINTAGIISTVAGCDSLMGFSGDGGPATAAAMNTVMGVAPTSAGELYIADMFNHRIRRVSASGIITTVAGTGTSGFSGDLGPAIAAMINTPNDLCTDMSGNVYIADYLNYRVRKMMTSDFIPVFTGTLFETIPVCSGVPDSMNSLLSILDSNIGQTETWSISTPALHGTASASCTATSTGSVIIPHSTWYTSATGYTGMDSFKVSVFDGIATVIKTIYVSVGNCALSQQLAPVAALISVYPNPADNLLTISDENGYYTTVEAVNTTGQRMAVYTLTNKQVSIDVTKWPAGLYYLSLRGAQGNMVRKFIKN